MTPTLPEEAILNRPCHALNPSCRSFHRSLDLLGHPTVLEWHLKNLLLLLAKHISLVASVHSLKQRVSMQCMCVRLCLLTLDSTRKSIRFLRFIRLDFFLLFKSKSETSSLEMEICVHLLWSWMLSRPACFRFFLQDTHWQTNTISDLISDVGRVFNTYY